MRFGKTYNSVRDAFARITTLEVVLLLLLDLQLLGQLQQDTVNQLVVCQLVLRTNPDSGEDLIMDVSIQSLLGFSSINPNDIAISRRGRSDLIRPSSDVLKVSTYS